MDATCGFSIVFETSEEYKSSFLEYAIFSTENDEDFSKNVEINSPTLRARPSTSRNGMTSSEPNTLSSYNRASIKQHIRATFISSERPSTTLKKHKKFSFNPIKGFKRLCWL